MPITQELYQIKVTCPTLALSPHEAGEREVTAKGHIWVWKVGPSRDKKSRERLGEAAQGVVLLVRTCLCQQPEWAAVVWS